jgi:hypothetical protein
MTLQPKRFAKRVADIRSITYSATVPFHMACAVCEHTLITNDDLAPEGTDIADPIPSYGAMYRLIGDGTHSPTFDSAFKKSSGSGDYVATALTVNLISFIFDGVDYWYNIIQPQ